MSTTSTPMNAETVDSELDFLEDSLEGRYRETVALVAAGQPIPEDIPETLLTTGRGMDQFRADLKKARDRERGLQLLRAADELAAAQCDLVLACRQARERRRAAEKEFGETMLRLRREQGSAESADRDNREKESAARREAEMLLHATAAPALVDRLKTVGREIVELGNSIATLPDAHEEYPPAGWGSESARDSQIQRIDGANRDFRRRQQLETKRDSLVIERNELTAEICSSAMPV